MCRTSRGMMGARPGAWSKPDWAPRATGPWFAMPSTPRGWHGFAPRCPESNGSDRDREGRAATAPMDDKDKDRFPATIFLCLAWVGLYAAMASFQGSWHAESTRMLSGGIRVPV